MIISRVSPNQLFVVLLVVEVSSVSLGLFTKKPVVFWKFFLKMLFVIQWHTLNTLVARLLPQWMWYTLSKDKEKLCMVLEDKKFLTGNDVSFFFDGYCGYYIDRSCLWAQIWMFNVGYAKVLPNHLYPFLCLLYFWYCS